MCKTGPLTKIIGAANALYLLLGVPKVVLELTAVQAEAVPGPYKLTLNQVSQHTCAAMRSLLHQKKELSTSNRLFDGSSIVLLEHTTQRRVSYPRPADNCSSMEALNVSHLLT